MENGFTGFPREVPRFWFDLKLNNTYEKQAENVQGAADRAADPPV